jgi:hypothetical protein
LEQQRGLHEENNYIGSLGITLILAPFGMPKHTFDFAWSTLLIFDPRK